MQEDRQERCVTECDEKALVVGWDSIKAHLLATLNNTSFKHNLPVAFVPEAINRLYIHSLAHSNEQEGAHTNPALHNGATMKADINELAGSMVGIDRLQAINPMTQWQNPSWSLAL